MALARRVSSGSVVRRAARSHGFAVLSRHSDSALERARLERRLWRISPQPRARAVCLAATFNSMLVPGLSTSAEIATVALGYCRRGLIPAAAFLCFLATRSLSVAGQTRSRGRGILGLLASPPSQRLLRRVAASARCVFAGAAPPGPAFHAENPVDIGMTCYGLT